MEIISLVWNSQQAFFFPLMQEEEKKAVPWHARAVRGQEAELRGVGRVL